MRLPHLFFVILRVSYNFMVKVQMGVVVNKSDSDLQVSHSEMLERRKKYQNSSLDRNMILGTLSE